MNILAIDIGTYSIKFYEIKTERKTITESDKTEIILDDVRPHYPTATTILDLQKEIVANFIQKKSNDTRIIFQIPNDFITTRYLEIPGSSKRKTEQIIPFQLDENLPYSLGLAHFSSRLIKRNSGFSVISNITQLNVFKDFIHFFEAKDAQPTTITSEISIIQSYIENIRLNENCCILDIGHKTTKAYFIQDRKIVANHTTYLGGAHINELISKTYQISIEDAILYKHENAFFLTDRQLDSVRPEQKEFALLMKQLFLPLTQDFKRWDIGHRVKYGNNIDRIYLLGGSSQINGIDNFIEYFTGIKVNTLPPLTEIKNDYSIHDKSFFLVKMMALSERTPSALINFLSGRFQTTSSSIIPMHSAVFIWVRSSFIALLLFLSLAFERFVILNNNEKVLDNKISSLLKQNQQIAQDIPKNIRKEYKKSPENLLRALNKKNKIIKDEVNNILSSNTINALSPLAKLSRAIASNPKVSLVKFSSDGQKIEAVFNSEELAELEKLQTQIKNVNFAEFDSKLKADRKELIIQFLDRG